MSLWCRIFGHKWPVLRERKYELPDPDWRNPVQVYKCTRCGAEKHESAFGRTLDVVGDP